MNRMVCFIALAIALLVVSPMVGAADLTSSLKAGKPELKSAGPMAFGPDGVLFVGDTRAAAVFAIATGDIKGDVASTKVNVEAINEKIASLLGTDAPNVSINDIAVNPSSGNVYISVSRGQGPEAVPVIVKVDSTGNVGELSLNNVKFAKSSLPNAPESSVGRRGDPRDMSITDIAYVDGRIFVAGLSNEEFASKLRSIPFPFKDADAGTSVEIYHGAHGQFETRSPVRTFAAYEIGGEANLLCAYTCTPLVRFSVTDLTPGKKLVGTTIAELGNRNNPLDMVVYTKGGKDYILLANSSRGVMKITTEGIEKIEGITDRVGGTAGLTYDTIKDLAGVYQLDKLNDTSAVVLVQTEEGAMNLKTIMLP